MGALARGSIIGILGGGQLGRMLALAAAPLGFRCHVYDPDPGAPAKAVTDLATEAAYTDEAALDAFAASVDVVTYEFENIPVAAVERLTERVPVWPGARALGVAQDRLAEKDFVNSVGGRTAPYYPVESEEDGREAGRRLGYPYVLKTRRFGYDGKGQVKVADSEAVAASVAQVGGKDLIAEGFIPFERELSVVLARGQDGAIRSFPVVENKHRDHILDETIAPADVSAELGGEASRIAETLIRELDYVGVLAVEMFEVEGRVLVNEIAPRVHNSGHWTMDACAVGQFEAHIRAITGLGLPNIGMHSRAVMKNLLGDEIHDRDDLVQEENLRFHDYGKAEARPGRKMGHVTRLYPLSPSLSS